MSKKNQKHINIAYSKENKYSFLLSEDDIFLTITTANTFKEVLYLQSLPFLSSIIIDCNTISYFISDHNSLINYIELIPVLIQTADSCIFSIIGKKDIKVLLPIGDKSLPTPITLKNIYYLSLILFKLIFVTCITWAGFSV